MAAGATKSLSSPAPGSFTPAPAPQAARSPSSATVSPQSGTPFLRLAPLSPVTPGGAAGGVRELLARESGAPLAVPVKAALERSLGIDLSSVRVHQGAGAEALVRARGARAFAVGSHIMLGVGERADDLALIAHEVAHVVQQQGGATVQPYGAATASDGFEREAHGVSAAVVSGRPAVVRERTSPRPQFLFGWVKKGLSAVGGAISDAASAVADAVGNVIGLALDFIRDHARLIPGYDLLAFVLGKDPITQAHVDRSPVNLVKGLMGLWPGGSLIFDALQAHGIIAKVGAWLSVKLDTLMSIVSGIGSALDRFLHTLGAGDLLDLGGAYDRAKAIFSVPVGQALAFVGGLAAEVLGFIRDAILIPVAKLAEGTNGYNLLKAVLGKDPITGEAVPQDAETLIGGFMKFIHQDEIWENMQKAKAIPRAFAWFKKAMSELMGFVRAIPDTFINALKSLDVADMILIPRAFAKLGKAFGTFALKFISWAGGTIWNLLEIIFDVVSPGALTYIKKTGAAIKSIFKNPIPFVGNLVKAAKLGFNNFADHFGEHLKKGLIDWLTGSLPGVYIPKAFTLGEIVKFVFSVLGLSWANIRGKLVKVVGETAVSLMEAGFDIVLTLVREGPAAAWDKIKAQIDALKDQVINGIIGMVVEAIATKAVPKMIAMFIPGAGFISAIVSIYDTVMVFVEKISKIIEVVTAFVDSIVNIAAGQIGGAAKKVESVLANLLSLAISFLAGFAGLGKIADKIMGVIVKVRDTVDKGLDALIDWIVTMAKKLFARAFGKNKDDKRTDAEKLADLGKAKTEAEALQKKPGIGEAEVKAGLPAIQKKYKLTSIDLKVDSQDQAKEKVHIHVAINPELDTEGTEVEIGGVLYVKATNSTPPQGSSVGALKAARSNSPKQYERNVTAALEGATKLTATRGDLPATFTEGTLLEQAQVGENPMRRNPDLLLMQGGKIEIFEVTLDSEFQVGRPSPGSGVSAKRMQLAGNVHTLSQLYPEVPIVYNIRVPKNAPPHVTEELAAELMSMNRDRRQGKALSPVQIIWRHD